MISIIGAGPAGSFAAYNLAKAGYVTHLYEDNAVVGKPVQCTGICTSVLDLVLRVPKSVVMNTITYAKVISPSNNAVTIHMKTPNYILCRASFDRHVANLALDAGTHLHTSHRFVGRSATTLRFKTQNETIEKKMPDMLIGADGPNSTVGRIFGMTQQPTVMRGAQASVKLDIPEDTLEFYPMPNGYKWVVPEGDGVVRIGLAVYNQPNLYFKQFIRDRCPASPILEYQGGLIPKYNPGIVSEKNNILLVGDAATHVKWTTGGGIIQGLIAAKAAADSIISEKSYAALWKAKLRRELWLHLQVRNIMDRFSLKDYDKLITLTDQERIRTILSTHDRDAMSQFLFQMICKEPRYLTFAKTLFQPPNHVSHQ